MSQAFKCDECGVFYVQNLFSERTVLSRHGKARHKISVKSISGKDFCHGCWILILRSASDGIVEESRKRDEGQELDDDADKLLVEEL